MKPNGYLQTADRALQVLAAFTGHHTEWGVTDLARELELEKSQVQRLLATLAFRGFLAADPRTRRYRLGPTLIGLGRLAEQGDSVTALVRPVLTRLAQAARHSAVFNLPDDASYRCAAAVDGPGPIRYTSVVGQLFPGHGGAGGHAIFAHYPESALRALFGEQLERVTDTTAGTLSELLARHELVRRRGVAVSDGEYDARVTAAAAPVFAQTVVIGSVAVIGPREHVTPHVEQVAALVRRAAGEITELLARPWGRAPEPSAV
ncbi:MAG: IclR family transcriptional regulator [Micromonosporaceae bacterium]